jgi:hypothetical protein
MIQVNKGHNAGTMKGILTNLNLACVLRTWILWKNLKTFGQENLKLEHWRQNKLPFVNFFCLLFPVYYYYFSLFSCKRIYIFILPETLGFRVISFAHVHLYLLLLVSTQLQNRIMRITCFIIIYQVILNELDQMNFL